MKYRRQEAKDYARQNLRGIFAATLTPFAPDLSLDEAGWRRNLRHWYRDLGIRGLFVNGKQGEFASMTVAERKRVAEVAVEEAGSDRSVMVSCSDQSIDTVVELAKHAQAIGAEYIVVHTPLLYFGAHTSDTLFEYYRHVAEQVDIGVALWNQPPDCGYTLEPEVCMRIAELPNIVAIKYSVERELYAKPTRMAAGKLIVSTSSEEHWLDNIVELGWRLYLCSTPPFLLQTKNDRRMHEYTELAFAGKVDEARKVRNSLDPVRKALKESRPAGKAASHQKYWQELLGQAGGRVRRPLLELTEAEKAATRAAFESCGLRVGGEPRRTASAAAR
jgi:4-hydroxy-tetrahydrodipicolinate synthase